MPLIEHSQLSAFGYLRRAGFDIVSQNRAKTQDIRELHVGLLNMMPDAALEATERQFIGLVGSCNKIAQFFVHPFSLPELNRGEEAASYIDRCYADFDQIKQNGLDALIITGTNIANPDLPKEPFWDPLIEVVEWANDNVASTLCSCLATHALLRHFCDIHRVRLPAKKWGVYSHRVCTDHPLLRNINTKFDVPHSRFNDISRGQIEEAGLTVLAESESAGVHMATSPDGLRVVYFQGHPEYDFNSLFKEYKRELVRFTRDELSQPPPHPENYIDTHTNELVDQYTTTVIQGKSADTPLAKSLEQQIDDRLHNTWGDTGKAVFNNWLGLVYQLTNVDRNKQYMDGVNPKDPLASLNCYE